MNPRQPALVLASVLLALSTSASAQTAPAAPAPAAATAGGPNRGTWELRFPLGAALNATGQPLESQNQALFGFTLGYGLSRQLSLYGGISGAVDKDFLGGSAIVGLRYRSWDWSSIVKPFLTGGVVHHWFFPRAGKNKNTITAVSIRTGAGVDFAITDNALWSVQFDLDSGPRLLPSVGAFVNVNLSGGFTFLF